MATHDEEDITPPETKELVNRTLELLTQQAGAVRKRRNPQSVPEIEERLKMIRQQAEAYRSR